MADFDVQQVRDAAARVLFADCASHRGLGADHAGMIWEVAPEGARSEFVSNADAALAVIVPAVTAQIRTLHRPVHLTFSWKEGVRAEDPCEVCGGRAGGDRECGCWGDVDRDLYCLSCSDLSGHPSHRTDYPCPTVRLLDQIEAAARGAQ